MADATVASFGNVSSGHGSFHSWLLLSRYGKRERQSAVAKFDLCGTFSDSVLAELSFLAVSEVDDRARNRRAASKTGRRKGEPPQGTQGSACGRTYCVLPIAPIVSSSFSSCWKRFDVRLSFKHSYKPYSKSSCHSCVPTLAVVSLSDLHPRCATCVSQRVTSDDRRSICCRLAAVCPA